MELARLLAPRKGQLQRGILFASFAGEELGLLGSAEWAKDPTLPIGKAVAMINMDMIGRIKDEKVFIGGVGTGSTFKTLLEEEKAGSPFNFEYSATAGYAASDHDSPLSRKKFLSFFFFSGLHLGLPQALRHSGTRSNRARMPQSYWILLKTLP